jgi:hypothetical protein
MNDAERTIDFLARQSGERPFLCAAGFYFPHAPWVVPQRYLDLYDPSRLSLPDYPPHIDAQRSDEYFSDTCVLARVTPATMPLRRCHL